MRGKVVNLCIGVMNILFGILILLFTLYIPKDLTIQENTIKTYISYSMYIVSICIATIDIVQSYNHRSDTTFNLSYILGIFCISFIFIKQPAIAIFSILSGVLILIKSLTENLVELNSTFGISVSIVMMAVIFIIGLVAINYSMLGENIKKKENKDETAYKDNFFEYITELDISEAYINVKKDGKYGYVNQNGEIVMDFTYDFASPFVTIEAYDKKFEVALVSKDNRTLLIMKNGRIVMSYKDESLPNNYGAKIKELENIYKNTLKQEKEMEYEIPNDLNNNINKAPVYQENQSNDYTYRYDYNDRYDVIVTQSKLGLKDKYELANKENINDRLILDTTNLDYDENYLYLFSNGTIPFYEVSKRVQGWFSGIYKKEMTGKGQILDFYEDRLLIRDYNQKSIFFLDLEENVISDKYKDIYLCPEGRYIVEDNNELYYVMDSEYKNIFETQYTVINPRLSSRNMYLVADTTDNIEFNEFGYAKMNWKLLNYDGEVVLDGIEQVYDLYLKEYTDEKTETDNYNKFVKELKKLNYKFVGDKFYSDYIK